MVFKSLANRFASLFLKEFHRGESGQLLNALYRDTLLGQSRANEPGRLLRYGQKIYSQADEDGIIQEIFRRIDEKSRFFIEIGAGKGIENNTLHLLVQGWRGLWVEGSAKHFTTIQSKLQQQIADGQLKAVNEFVTIQNINSLIGSDGIPDEIDLLSVDVDGNDYHLIETIDPMRARVVIVEYNAKFPPPTLWVMKYNPNHCWDHTDYFGASLKSYELLLSKKGYSLVGCNIAGTNAFFVRNDCLGDCFCSPFTAENHYEPSRYWLVKGYVAGYKTRLGEFDRK